jgi:hypothetical protein
MQYQFFQDFSRYYRDALIFYIYIGEPHYLIYLLSHASTSPPLFSSAPRSVFTYSRPHSCARQCPFARRPPLYCSYLPNTLPFPPLSHSVTNADETERFNFHFIFSTESMQGNRWISSCRYLSTRGTPFPSGHHTHSRWDLWPTKACTAAPPDPLLPVHGCCGWLRESQRVHAVRRRRGY